MTRRRPRCASSPPTRRSPSGPARLARRSRARERFARGSTDSIAPVSEAGLRASGEKMREEGVADAAIRAFEHYYRQLEEGETGLIPEDSIEPVTDVTDLDDLDDDA